MLLAALALLSLVLTVWQWWVAFRFPLHERIRDTHFARPVTLLKPLKGFDSETEACLRSWFQQEYPGPVQILFGVASPSDPAFGLIRKLIEQHPTADAELLICPESLGANGKVSTLAQLQPRAKYDILVVSDADVRAPPDLLTNLVAPLSDEKVGLVNCFYRLANPATPALHWEAVAINADFWSQVLQSQSLKPLDFALGAVMATTRRHLEGIGGFAALRDYLADDYQLGHKIARKNGRIVLCTVAVECWSAPLNWRQVWTHQLRWARTIRICQPLPYFLSVLSNATLWPLVWLISHPTPWVLSAVIVCLLIRAVTAYGNQHKLAPDTARVAYAWLPWVKDLLNAVIWAGSFAGNTVEWRGQRYRVQHGGELVKLGSASH